MYIGICGSIYFLRDFQLHIMRKICVDLNFRHFLHVLDFLFLGLCATVNLKPKSEYIFRLSSKSFKNYIILFVFLLK